MENIAQELIDIAQGVISPKTLIGLLENIRTGNMQLTHLKRASDYKVLDSCCDEGIFTPTKVISHGVTYVLKGDYLYHDI